LYVAKGSCGAIRCQLYIALDQNYIIKKELIEIYEKLKRLSIMLNNLIQSLKKSKFKEENINNSLSSLNSLNDYLKEGLWN